MKHKPIQLLLVAVFLPAITWAQKTIYNVPFSEVIKPGKIFGQVQFDYTGGLFRQGYTATVGLPNRFEVGLNYFDIAYMEDRKGLHPAPRDPDEPDQVHDLLVNAQKDWSLTRELEVAIGTRTGITLPEQAADRSFYNFSYLNGEYVFPMSTSKIVTGVYYANQAAAGQPNHFGAMAGVEYAILPETFAIQAEVVTGAGSWAQSIVGAEVYLGQFTLTAGAVLPWINTPNPSGFTLQVSYGQ